MEFPRTASQNTDHTSLSDPSLLIHFLYPGPSLILSFIDIAAQGPVIKRLHSEWTINLFGWAVYECIVFFLLFVDWSLSFLYLLVVYIPPQGSLLDYPSSSSKSHKPSQTHSHFPHFKYISFDSLGYIHDPPSIFTFNDVRLLTLYWELVSWCCFLLQEHIQRGELLLITIWDDPSKDYYEGLIVVITATIPLPEREAREHNRTAVSLWLLGCSSLHRISIIEVLSRYYHLFNQIFTGRRDNRFAPSPNAI